MKVQPIDGAGAAAWDAFAAARPDASFYHQWGWKDVIERTFGHRTYYLAAEEGGEIRGILPLAEMRSALFGHFLVSLPFFNYGGILAADEDAASALARSADELASRCGARHVEMRQAQPWSQELPGWTRRQHKASLTIRLAGATAHWDGISSRLRGKVRKAEKNGATFAVRGAEALGDFYHLYALNMRDLGTPVYAPALFENVFRLAPQKATVLMVSLNGRPAAAALAVRQGGRIELPWICQDYSASAANVNEFLYWKAIEWACGENAAVLDLGRSSVGAGTYKFKLQWNPEVIPLDWLYWMAPGVALPELNPNNPKYALAVKGWQKLPLPVANRLGPWIVRNIP